MFGGRAGFSLSFAEVGRVLPLIESESVKGGLGFGEGDSEPFFPGEPGASFGCFHGPIHALPFGAFTVPSSLCSSGGGKAGSASRSMCSSTSGTTGSPDSVTTRYPCAARRERKDIQLARFSCTSFMIGLISSPSPVVSALVATCVAWDCSSIFVEGGDNGRDGSGLASAASRIRSASDFSPGMSMGRPPPDQPHGLSQDPPGCGIPDCASCLPLDGKVTAV